MLIACGDKSETPDTSNIDELVPEIEPYQETKDPKVEEQPAENRAQLPADWPADVELAEYMNCVSVTRVDDDFMVTFHAPNKSLDEVVEWFRSTMTSNNWESNGDTKTPGGAILAFAKDARTCGISFTDFVLSPSMQRDETTKGITIQTKAMP